MSDIVRYNNDMNLVQFNKFKDKELDLFFSICYKMKEKDLNEITLDFSELRKLSNYTNKNLERFVKDLDNTYRKLIELNFKYEDENILERFVLFTQYRIEKDNRIVKIAVNERFKYILNELGSTYTKFELEQFVSLRSIYSKNLFKILKQWESLKEKTFDLDEFREILNIPKSYNFSKINVKIIGIIMKELNPYFSNFKLEKIRVGRKIKKLKFTWAIKSLKESKLLEIEILISLKLKKAIEKAKKNKFLKIVLTKENIKKLIEKFEEKVLINAFNKAYQDIKKDINYNYLKKYIENTLNTKEIKFVVEKELSPIEAPVEIEEELKKEIEAPKEKKKVTQKQKEEKYKEYLEKHDLEDNKFNKKGFEVNFDEEFEVIEKSIETKILFDDLGRAYPESLGSYEGMESYKRKFEQENPELMAEYKEKNKRKRDRELERAKYMKKLKTIELDLIMSNSIELDEFQINYMQFFRLHDYINNEMDLEIISNDKIKEVQKRLKALQDYFYQFEEKKEEEIINFEEIEEEQLLSKKGKPLFGGALISRLTKIAKILNIKIRYKDKIIES